MTYRKQFTGDFGDNGDKVVKEVQEWIEQKEFNIEIISIQEVPTSCYQIVVWYKNKG